MLASKVDVDAFSEIRNFGSDHVGWLIGHIVFSTVLTPEARLIFHNFASTVVRKTCRIKNSVIIFDSTHVTIQKEEMVLISIVLSLKDIVNFTN